MIDFAVNACSVRADRSFPSTRGKGSEMKVEMRFKVVLSATELFRLAGISAAAKQWPWILMFTAIGWLFWPEGGKVVDNWEVSVMYSRYFMGIMFFLMAVVWVLIAISEGHPYWQFAKWISANEVATGQRPLFAHHADELQKASFSVIRESWDILTGIYAHMIPARTEVLALYLALLYSEKLPDDVVEDR